MAKKKNRKKESIDTSKSENTFDVRIYSARIASGLSVLSVGLLFATPLIPEGGPEDCANWILLLLWMLAAAAVFVKSILEPNSRFPFGIIDFCFFGVCLFSVMSGLYSLVTDSGHARPTINSTWQWVGFAAIYFVLRSQSTDPKFRRLLLACGLCVAVGCTMAGLYQRYVVAPGIRADYQSKTEEQKQSIMLASGVSDSEPDSRERVMWENRLFSTEATSTFVLANSFAAFLVPWLIVCVAFLIANFRSNDNQYWQILIVTSAAMFFCLLVTKSRTAYIAVFVGILMTTLSAWLNSGKKFPWKQSLIGIVIIGVLVFVALMTRAVDAEVLSESVKSMSYRLEYWIASLKMISEHFWFGCGPGNFQQAYGAYQLPQSSETVGEPHNFLLEVWAVAGTPAAILLVVGMCFWCWSNRPTFSSVQAIDADGSEDSQTERQFFDGESRFEIDYRLLLGGFVFGALVALFQNFINGNGVDVIAVAILFTGLSSLIFWTYRGNDFGWVVPIALFSFFIGLIASGGIGFPSVASSGILLIAIGKQTKLTQVNFGPLFSGICFALIIVAVFLFRGTVVEPIQRAKTYSNLAEKNLRASQLELAMKNLKLAVGADPYDGNYRFFLTQMQFRDFNQNPTMGNLEVMIDAAGETVKVRPRNGRVALETAKLFLAVAVNAEISDQSILQAARGMALDLLTESIRRRPNNALGLAYLSLAQSMDGNEVAARLAAQNALRLNELNPHSDKDLAKMAFRIEGRSSELSVEQELQKIRKKSESN